MFAEFQNSDCLTEKTQGSVGGIVAHCIKSLNVETTERFSKKQS